MSDKQAHFSPESITIVEFKMVKGQVDTPEDFDLSMVEGHHLNNSLKLGFNIDNKLVKADFEIEIKTDSKGKNPKECLGYFNFVFIFQIDNLKELAKAGKNQLMELDPLLGNALSSITYSTSRGILLTRLQGSALQDFVLPVINPNKLLPPKKRE